MKKILFGFVMVFVAASCYCQAPDWEWVSYSSQGSDDYSFGQGIIVGADGYVYSTGSFQGVVDFGSGQLTGDSSGDFYLSKYNSSGTCIWSKSADDPNSTESDGGRGVVADSVGYVYVTGYFKGNTEFGANSITSSGANGDGFLAKYDASGNCIWATGLGPGEGEDVTVDNTGFVYVCGRSTSAVANGEAFVAKYDTSGVVVWTRKPSMTPSTGGDNSLGYGVGIDESGSVFLTVGFNGIAEIEGQFFTPFNSNGWYDGLLVKYNSDGGLLWANHYGMLGGNMMIDDVLIDKDGGVATTGRFFGQSIFGSDTLYASNLTDLFVSKCDSSGTGIWAVSYDEDKIDRGYHISTDQAGNYYVAGHSTIYNGNFVSNEKLLVLKYQSNGTLSWVKSASGSLGTGFTGITRDEVGNIYVAGAVDNDYGGISFFDNISVSPNSQSALVAKLGSQCVQNPLTLETNQSSTTGVGCDVSIELIASGGEEPYSYQWDANADNQTTDELTNVCPGEYCATVVDANGCTDNICVLVTTVVGVDENHDRGSFEFYPNPNNGQFNLQMSNIRHCDVQVFNALGQSVLSRQFNSTDRVSIELSNAGVYHFVVKTDEAIYTEKVVVNQ